MRNLLASAAVLFCTTIGMASADIVSHEEVLFDSPDAKVIRIVIAPGDTWTPKSERGTRLVVAVTSNHTRRHTKKSSTTLGQEIARSPGDTVCRTTPAPTIHNLNEHRSQISVIVLLKKVPSCPAGQE